MPKPAKRYAPAAEAAEELRRLADELESRGLEARWYITISFDPKRQATLPKTLSLGFKFPGEENG